MISPMTRSAFVLMPFATEFDDIYQFLIREAVASAGYEVTRADDILNQRNLLADIVEAIRDAALIVADLSTANPNVYYELGLAHAFGKPVILLAQDINEVPFDLRSYRVVTYSTHFSRMNEAREELKQLAAGARDGSVQFGSPVSDFGALSGDAGLSKRPGHSRVLRDDRGLLDFQHDLEESFDAMSAVLEEVGKRFHVLNPQIVTTTELLKDSANTSSKKRRAAMQSLAASMDEYSNWLRGSNTQYRKALASVGESLDGLLSGEFKMEPDAGPQLRSFIATMQTLEQQANEGSQSFRGVVSTLDTLPRIEKEFNRAKRMMSEELKNLVDNIEQTIATIARGRNAAKQLLGDSNDTHTAAVGR